MQINNWKHNLSAEDRLIKRYLQTKRRGVIFTEVTVDNHPDNGGRARRLDAVRILDLRLRDGWDRVHQYSQNRRKLKDAINGHPVEVIEAKRALGRSVVGQVIVGAELLKMKYRVGPVQKTVVCLRGNRSIEKVCKNLGIHVKVYER